MYVKVINILKLLGWVLCNYYLLWIEDFSCKENRENIVESIQFAPNSVQFFLTSLTYTITFKEKLKFFNRNSKGIS